ncbi:hypothetical protein AVEN_257834-1 [Araneus ventricosus]|uniref:Uncharacterized protein n=1 Tax=Araneus ventricosus TaxID=182803 RepID=A0A4Y2UJK0_ARAVE|nr:hypothetical protein AVEN_257834-1 [Araneus ventricosus]
MKHSQWKLRLATIDQHLPVDVDNSPKGPGCWFRKQSPTDAGSAIVSRSFINSLQCICERLRSLVHRSIAS